MFFLHAQIIGQFFFWQEFIQYEANHIPKKWASNELNFLTQHLQTLEKLDKKVSSLYCCISNTYKNLSSCFTRDTIATQERKRAKRRKNDQKRKKIKRQKNLEMKLAHKLLVKTHVKEVADSFLEGSFKQKFSAKQLGTIKLLPRFQLKL